MKYRNIILTLFLAVMSVSSFAKSSKSSVIEEEINKVYQTFEIQRYDQSLESLFIVLTLDTIIPDETAFLLGVAFSRLGRTESSQVALLKYLRLTKDQGDYFRDCIDELHRVNENLGIEEETDAMICDILGPLNETMVCPTCLGEKNHAHECKRCHGAKQEICDVCRGQGVIVRFSYYNEYSECYECHGKGYTECDRCEGEGLEIQKCRQCKAEGVVPKPRECNYFAEEEVQVPVEEVEQVVDEEGAEVEIEEESPLPPSEEEPPVIVEEK